MGKITKKASEKHRLALSQAVIDFVQKLTVAPLAELPSLFANWSQRWPIPRGELYNWIDPLDRFDKILDDFNIKYGLTDGPQKVSFGVSLLLEGSQGADEKSLKQMGFGSEGDRELVESILVFSRLLVEKSANRTIYNSTDRLNCLLNTTSLSLLHSTLRLTIFLAQRYFERSPLQPQPTKFYDMELEKLHFMAIPFSGPYGFMSKRHASSPVKTRSKDKTTHTPGRPRRGSSAVNPNDFRSLSRDVSVQSSTGKPTSTIERDWSSWVHVTMSWSPVDDGQASNMNTNTSKTDVEQADPSTPTPLRQQTGSTLSRTTTSDSMSPQDAHKPKKTEAPISGSHHLEFSAAELLETSIETLLEQHCKDMSPLVQFQFLHKLRVAYGLMSSSKSRRDLLSIRLLAVNSLANICAESRLSKAIFGDHCTLAHYEELLHQIVSLLQDARKGQGPVSLYLQTLAMETLGVLARHKQIAPDIISALGANTTHGLLFRLTQKGLADIAKDGDNTDTLVGDDWREAIFSMPRVVIEATGHHGRSSENVMATQFLTAYMSGLNIVTGKSLRIHLRMLDFIKTFFHHFKDGLAALLNTNAFEAVGNLMGTLTNAAWALLQVDQGIPGYYKTKATDYEIPYIHQQIIRSIVDMINDISGHQGAHADRVLRNLIDSHSLLGSFRLILDQSRAFGPFTWSEVVKAVCGFLHNEPTSYTLIAEAGISRSLLNVVVPSKARPTPTPDTKNWPIQISSKPQGLDQGVPPVLDAIASISQSFGAICLTSAGFELFRDSGALEKFFEIFESPAHLRVLKDDNTLALLGSTFDELVRHHPSLRDAVLSAVVVMLSRVRYRCLALARNPGAGPKLWLNTGGGGLAISGGNEALRLEITPGNRTDESGRSIPREPLKLPTGDFLVFEAPETIEAAAGAWSDVDSHGLSAADYVRPAISFLMNFFENPALCNSLMEMGGTDMILDLITLPSQAVNDPAFGGAGISNELTAVVHMMAETKPHLVLPVLANNMQYACNELKHFSQYQPSTPECYFDRLLKTEISDPENLSDSEKNGTRIAKSLMAIHSLALVASECFGMAIYSSRSALNVLFGQVNLADIFADVCRMMGTIAAACYREEIAMQRIVSPEWLSETRPEMTTGVEEVDAVLGLRSNSDEDKRRSSANDPTDVDTTLTEKVKIEKRTAGFKNVDTLRHLLIETPSAINQFLMRIGRGLAGRRRMDSFSRQKSGVAAKALADAYLAQLKPYFFRSGIVAADESDDMMDFRFRYLVVALPNFKQNITDDSHTAIGESTRQSLVLDAFRKAGGIRVLSDIGTSFFDQLKSCKVAHSMILANTGLKICLEILDDVTNSKLIMESAQSSNLRNLESNRPVLFVPGQVLLELRMEALVLARRIWSSDYTDQASRDVVKRLISILRHVLTADQETDAVQTDAAFPNTVDVAPRKYIIDETKVNNLKDKGYAEDLAREALYRCNSHSATGLVAAEEYCKAMTLNPARQRLPIPGSDTDVPATSRHTPVILSPAVQGQASGATIAATLQGTVDAALAEIVNNAAADDEMPDMPGIPATDSAAQSATAPNQSSITTFNDQDVAKVSDAHPGASVSPETPARYTVQSINAQREELREDLTERCINILNNHQDLTFELSELINSSTKNLSDEATKQFWETTSALLVNSLLSMQSDEDLSEAGGKKVAAAAHLTALLIQDADVFKKSFGVFQDTLEGLLQFLKLPTSGAREQEEAFPWIAPILLIVERILSRDSEPAEIEWKQPHDLDSFTSPILTKYELFDAATIRQLFDAIVAILPRIGKDKTLGLSVSRVLVILSRRRDIVTLLTERGNLQRLFLMVKQLSVDVGSKLQSALMIILRHIVEDQDTLKQIMRSEITAYFNARSNNRPTDMTSYVRDMSHMAIRSPEVFIEVTNDIVKLAAFPPHASSPLALKLSIEGENSSTEQNDAPDRSRTQPASRPAESIEIEQPAPSSPTATKSTDGKAPIVDKADGVMHFILSELLAYKDVEDKEPASDGAKTGQASQQVSSTPLPPGTHNGVAMENANVESNVVPKPEKPKFKAEEHPMFIYRCFLLQCLSELLHSYNRTKIEFINFSRKADPMVTTPSKPRAGILNYLLHSLVPSTYVDREDTVRFKKKMMLSDCAIRVVVALCSKTGEMGLSASVQRYTSQPQVDDQDTEPDLAHVRRFVLDHAIKAFKEATSSTESIQVKYSRMLCLADMFNRLISKPAGSESSAASQNTSYKVLGRMMFERDLISVLTSSLAEIDLSYSGSKRVVKFILRPLQELTSTAVQLSLTSPDRISSVIGNTADGTISSGPSVSEIDDEREETPDLFRNSALGIMDPNRAHDYESESEGENEDEEMYDEEYEDEMDYEEEMPAGPNDDEAVSDDELIATLPTGGPMEGLPGDVPMDIEFVVDDPHMEVDSDENDDNGDNSDDEGVDDDDDDEDEDDDDENDDFMIEEEIEEMGEGAEGSLHDGHDEEDVWEDDEEGDDDEEDSDLDDEGLMNMVGPNMTAESGLDNLLRVLGEQDPNEPVVVHAPPGIAITTGEIMGQDEDDEDEIDRDDDDDNDDDDDDDDDDDVDLEDNEGEDMDEDDEQEMENIRNAYATLYPQAEIVDREMAEAWGWTDTPNHLRRHRQSRVNGGQMPSFFHRRLMGEPMHHTPTGRLGRHVQQGRTGTDDGINPLLQRPNADAVRRPARPAVTTHSIVLPDVMHGMPGQNGPSQTLQAAIVRGGEQGLVGHGAMLDAILQAIHRGDHNFLQNGRVQLNMTAPLPEIQQMIDQTVVTNAQHRYHARNPGHHLVHFHPASTTARWQEEARLLYGTTNLEKIQRIQQLLMSMLIPPAQAEEKIRRRKKEAEEKRAKEEAERKKVEEEEVRKAAEEREAAERAEEEARKQAEAEAQTATSTTEAGESTENETQPMEGIQSETVNEVTHTGDAEATGAGTADRVFITIRGRQLDITGMDIDLNYLQELPEEFREEVIMQQYSQRREAAQEQGEDAGAIDPEFLNALPEEIREELRLQEAQTQRRRERENARRQAAAAAGSTQAEEMDNDNFLATLDPALRRAILAEQPPEILQQLDPRHAAEARSQARRLFHFSGQPAERPSQTEQLARNSTQRDPKRQIVQLIDKAGVATILRLMFISQHGSLRVNLWHILRNVCGNRQTRHEVINLILTILKEGSTDVVAIEKSLASLSLRARATTSQKTPQPLKRTLSVQTRMGVGDEVTPLLVVQQCLAALKQLASIGFHIKTIFLRDVDSILDSPSKKIKGKETKSSGYPINDLISLLDRKLIMESSSCLQSLTELLASVTSPLPQIMRKDQKPEEEEKNSTTETQRSEAGPTSSTHETVAPLQHTTETENVVRDTEMVEVGQSTSNSNPSSDDPVPVPALPIEASNDEDVSMDEAKAKKLFTPPEISKANLQLLVKIFTAPECVSDTFRFTLETFSNLAFIPTTSAVFNAELTTHVRSISAAVCNDLDELLPQIREAQSSSDVQPISSAKFTPAGSDQVKLLRVLQALDYLSTPKKDGDRSKSDKTTEPSETAIVNTYESLSLGPTWMKLGDCLKAMEEKDNVMSFAQYLLPLIESLMVVCKNTSLKDNSAAKDSQDLAATTDSLEGTTDLEKLFFTFTTAHRQILNDIIRQSPKLMQGNGSFSLLVKNPKVLDFDNKRSYFTKQIHSRVSNAQRQLQPPLQLNVRREQVFQDSYKALYFKTANEMKYGKLNIRFNGEEGVDAGGVTREWFQVLARGIFNPDWALWQPVAADRTTFHPNPLSWINNEHLVYFKFIGRIIGKALHEGRVLDCHFSRAVYKRLLGKQPNLKDLESMDLDYYKSLLWILENDIADVLTEDFSVIEEQFGEEKVIDLIENGRNIPVTEQNKREYVQKLVEYRLTTSVQNQLDDFIKGFHDIIPADLIAIFDEQELELLISGLPEIDVDDWRANTEYHNYSANSPQITWFWRVVRAMSHEDRAKLLQFVTGTSKVPLDGFKGLEGMSGITKMSIHADPSKDRLPTSHTCFNQLDLPQYDNLEILKANLMKAINLGADYFGFA